MARDVWCLVEKLGWTKVHLVGLSMGGMISLEAALARPDLVSSLTLISTHGGGLGTIPPIHGLYKLVSVFRCTGMSGAVDFGIDVMFPAAFSDSASSKPPAEDWEPPTRRYEIARSILLRKRFYLEAGVTEEINFFGVLKQVSAIVTHYISWKRLEYLRAAGIPVLVCSGRLDNLISWKNSSMLAKALGCQHLHFVEGGHCVNEQFHEEVNLAIAELAEQGAKQASRQLKPCRPGLHPGVAFTVVAAAAAYIFRSWLQRNWPWQRAVVISAKLALGASLLAARHLA